MRILIGVTFIVGSMYMILDYFKALFLMAPAGLMLFGIFLIFVFPLERIYRKMKMMEGNEFSMDGLSDYSEKDNLDTRDYHMD
jgi:hypothetical protein